MLAMPAGVGGASAIKYNPRTRQLTATFADSKRALRGRIKTVQLTGAAEDAASKLKVCFAATVTVCQ